MSYKLPCVKRPRAKKIPVKNSIERSIMHSLPHLAIEEYVEAKQTTELILKYPEWDVARQGPEMKVIQLRRDLREAKRYLKHKRHEAKLFNRQMNEEVKELEASEHMLRCNFKKFNNFVVENKQKLDRAMKEIKTQKEHQGTIIEDIKDLKKKVKFFTSAKGFLENDIIANTIYETFLTEVAKKAHFLEDVQEILKRYDALSTARRSISTVQYNNMEELASVLANLSSFKDSFMPQVISLNVETAHLTHQYQAIKSVNCQRDAKLNQLKERAQQKNSEVSAIRSSCWDMYIHMAKRRGKPRTLQRGDTENQFEFVKDSVNQLKLILELTHHLAKKEAESNFLVIGSNSELREENAIKWT